MTNYLVDHALRNVWCNPRQDLQVILKPARLTPPRGVRGEAVHQWSTLALPTSQDYYHLFQVGQIHPSLLGFFIPYRQWVRLSTIIGDNNLMADVYTKEGVQLPRYEIWAAVTANKNLILAIRDMPKVVNLRTTRPYVRLYANAFFMSERAWDFEHRLLCQGERVRDAQHALDMQRTYNDLKALPGLTTLFVNGRFVHNYLPSQLVAGDYVEWVYDSTVKSVLSFQISELDSFDSLLDLKRKYLLLQNQIGDPLIDYRDDVDVYLVNATVGGTKWDGVYYHKNQDDAFRQVTHCDYSITIPYLQAYMASNPSWADLQALTIRLHIRESGYERPLVHEHHRIHELIKLDPADRKAAMLGVDASVPVWHAAALENSAYPVVMGKYGPSITVEDVRSAYGYNAVAKLTANTPLQTEQVDGRWQVSLPYGLQVDSTLYEYDQQGILLGQYYHAAGSEHTVVNQSARLVEGLVGKGGRKLSTVFGQQQTALDPQYNYRFYTCPIINGVATQQWTDVTGDSSKYAIVSGEAVWFTDPEAVATAIRSDKDFLSYDITLTPTNGLLKFSIDGDGVYPGGTVRGVLGIPPGKLELWLNHHALIEGLDYVVRWPQIVVINKAYLVGGDSQVITVRCTGFCESDMSRPVPSQIGFVEHGLLSRNRRYDLRDDLVQRIVVRGRTYHRSELLFSESDSGLYMQNVVNGSPYVIEDVVVPLRDLPSGDTYSYRALSKAIDTDVSNYLTLKLPEPTIANPDVISSKYAIYSPLCSTLLYDMQRGVFSMEAFKGQYSNRDVRDALADYLYLLDYDPTQFAINDAYVSIHPHNALIERELDIYQYTFLERVIKIFLHDKVDLTSFVSIKPGYV